MFYESGFAPRWYVSREDIQAQHGPTTRLTPASGGSTTWSPSSTTRWRSTSTMTAWSSTRQAVGAARGRPRPEGR
ncbi:hypothetical protein [Streptomyces sp. NBC_01578]|uniref:hypothetical protein n=1 Tax=unclassified Streptomyces TaxID=2593676 RepID=UPI00386693AD